MRTSLTLRAFLRSSCALLGLAAYLFHVAQGHLNFIRPPTSEPGASAEHPHARDSESDSGPSPVALQAIEVADLNSDLKPGEREICEHHPEGCPKACLCPKIRVQADGSLAEEAPLQPRAQGTTLTACSEGPDQAPGPSVDSARVAHAAHFIAEASPRLRPAPLPLLLGRPGEPPAKIPIG